MTVTAPAVTAWRFFDVRVGAVHRLSPSFVRLTLTGNDLEDLADNGWDQRFKLVLPDTSGGYDSLPRGPEWYAAWRRLPPERQNPIRTYTVRAVRPALREVDVDLVLHGDAGPASRFAARAVVGDRLVVLGPDARHPGEHGGLEFRPPSDHAGPSLLVGDATAVPAVLSVLEHLPEEAYGEVVLEVPEPADFLPGPTPVGFRVTWLVGTGRESPLPGAVGEALARLGLRAGTDDGAVDGTLDRAAAVPGQEDEELLWEVPDQAQADGLYAWIAGESSAVARLRRHLVHDLGLPRSSVAFMGYWRSGRPGG